MNSYGVKSTQWGIFTLELTRTVMYKSDLKNYKVLMSYAKLMNAPTNIIEFYENKVISLTEKIDYINSVLDQLHWKDKELLIRCYVKKYSNKMAGAKFNMDEKQVNGRISRHIRKALASSIDVNKLRNEAV